MTIFNQPKTPQQLKHHHLKSCFNFLSARRYIITMFNPRSGDHSCPSPFNRSATSTTRVLIWHSWPHPSPPGYANTRPNHRSLVPGPKSQDKRGHNKPLTTIDWPFHPSAATTAPKSGSAAGLSQANSTRSNSTKLLLLLFAKSIFAELQQQKHWRPHSRRLYISSPRRVLFSLLFSSCYLPTALRIDV